MSGGSNPPAGQGDPAGSYRFFENRACEYWPCHDLDRMNCLFCFCPLYPSDCGGNWSITEGGVKDCSACAVPHADGGYDYVTERLSRPGDTGEGEAWV